MFRVNRWPLFHESTRDPGLKSHICHLVRIWNLGHGICMDKTERYHHVLVPHGRIKKEKRQTIGRMPYGLGPEVAHITSVHSLVERIKLCGHTFSQGTIENVVSYWAQEDRENGFWWKTSSLFSSTTHDLFHLIITTTQWHHDFYFHIIYDVTEA